LKQISGKRFASLLEKNAWKLNRIKGSHQVYTKVGSIERISVPIHGNQPLKLGLLKHFMKIAEIEESEL